MSNRDIKILRIDDFDKIKDIINQCDGFHDSEVVGIDKKEDKSAQVSIEYAGKCYWFHFRGVRNFILSLDPKCIFAYEVDLEKHDEGIYFFVEEVGIEIYSEGIYLEMLDEKMRSENENE